MKETNVEAYLVSVWSLNKLIKPTQDIRLKLEYIFKFN